MRIKRDTSFDWIFRDADPKFLKKFIDYHHKNPDLYSLFERFAFEAKGSGRQRFSIWMIANRARWYSMIATHGKEFKVSNDYLACYARLLIWKNPEFEGFFQLKEMKKNRSVPRD